MLSVRQDQFDRYRLQINQRRKARKTH
jgi:hypothetical protein